MDLLDQLRTFVVVAEELHFGRAAARLNVSQPPLSRRIRALEARLGGRVFERTSRRVALTSLGRRLLPEAQALIEQAEQLESRIGRSAVAGPTELAIGLPDTASPAVLAGLLRAGGDADVAVEVVQGTLADLQRAVETEHVHVAVLEPPVRPPALAGPRLERALGAVLPADSPLLASQSLEPVDLDGLALVMPRRDAAPREHDRVLTELAAFGWSPSSIRSVDGPSAVAGHVLAGDAVGLGPRMPEASPGLAWRPLADGSVHAHVCVARRRSAGSLELEFAKRLEQLLIESDGWSRSTPAPTRAPQIRPSSGLTW